jgi:hypothetical protein
LAEVLNKVADCGFRAFHDFPGGEDWNIDHILAGTRGVFLIETKARRRRGSRNGQPAHEVIYNGESLQFPMSQETKTIEQAKMNAKWLSNFLEKKTGDPVRVEPVVVLPGWFVTLSEKKNFPVKVMNASYLQKFLRRQSEFIEGGQARGWERRRLTPGNSAGGRSSARRIEAKRHARMRQSILTI